MIVILEFGKENILVIMIKLQAHCNSYNKVFVCLLGYNIEYHNERKRETQAEIVTKMAEPPTFML